MYVDFKAEKCGMFLLKFYSYVAASPDGIVTCKCHGKSIIEIKCPYSIRDKFINQNIISNCDFLCLKNNEIVLSETHKYFT